MEEKKSDNETSGKFGQQTGIKIAQNYGNTIKSWKTQSRFTANCTERVYDHTDNSDTSQLI